jgi:hypothetical protein
MNNKLFVLTLLSIASAASFAQTSPLASATTASNATTASTAAGGTVVFAPTSGDSIVKYSASSAVAPQLVAGIDTCMGSTSTGIQGANFGVSLGSTWKDSDCRRVKDARELWNMGNHAAAMALLCTDDDTRYAIAVSGGMPVRRSDGATVPVACPMTKEEWIAKERPVLDPATGQPMTTAQLNPTEHVAVAQPVVQQSIVISSIDSNGVMMTSRPAKSPEDIEAHAVIVRANTEMAGHPVISK